MCYKIKNDKEYHFEDPEEAEKQLICDGEG